MGNWSDYILKLFQSTLPRRERLPIKSLIPYSFKFQSTLPRRERHSTWSTCSNIHNFNPHSHEGSDGVIQWQQLNLKKISIHTPTKGATCLRWTSNPSWTISIHTPTKGATLLYLYYTTL